MDGAQRFSDDDFLELVRMLTLDQEPHFPADANAYWLACGLCLSRVVLVYRDAGRPVAVMCLRDRRQKIPVLAKEREPYRMLARQFGASLKRTEEGRAALDYTAKISGGAAEVYATLERQQIRFDAELGFLFVARTYRHRGIASLLIDAGLRLFAQETSLEHPRCLVFTDSQSDWRYYEKMGWKSVLHEQVSIKAPGLFFYAFSREL